MSNVPPAKSMRVGAELIIKRSVPKPAKGFQKLYSGLPPGL
jgi:hypothetical protein